MTPLSPTLPPVPVYPRNGLPLVATDYGVYPDASDVTDRLQAFILGCQSAGRGAFLPPGTYMLSRRLFVTMHCDISGGGSPLPGAGPNCTMLKALPNFQQRPVGGVQPAILQTSTYAGIQGPSWAAGRIRNIGIDCLGLANLCGVAGHCLDDNTLFEDVAVFNGASGYLLTGTGGACQFNRCSAWNCANGGFRITSHPTIPDYGGTAHSCNGSYDFKNISGDDNGIALLVIEGAGLRVRVGHMRMEGPPTTADNAIRFRNNPLWNHAFTNISGNSVTIEGNFLGTIRGSGVVADAAVGVESDFYIPDLGGSVVVSGLNYFKQWIKNL